jgi:hypothetical protein
VDGHQAGVLVTGLLLTTPRAWVRRLVGSLPGVQLPSPLGKAYPYACDLTDGSAVEELDRITPDHGGVDLARGQRPEVGRPGQSAEVLRLPRVQGSARHDRPTDVYRRAPAMSPEQAAARAVRALEDRPLAVNTLVGSDRRSSTWWCPGSATR